MIKKDESVAYQETSAFKAKKKKTSKTGRENIKIKKE